MIGKLFTLGAIAGAGIASAAYFGAVSAFIQGAPVESSTIIKGLVGFAILLGSLSHDGLLKNFLSAVGRTLKHTPALFPLILLCGGVGHVLMFEFGPILVPWEPHPSNQQMVMLSKQLGHMVFLLIWVSLTFPVLNAAAIYCWRSEAVEGPSPNMFNTIAFGVSRFRRMFGPHAKAYILIAIGMAVLLPGIVYGLWYAFVDPITATDDRSNSPLKRSKKLTKGHRSAILRAWLPYCVWASGDMIMPLVSGWVEMKGTTAIFWHGSLDVLFLVIMKMSMYGLYERRIELARERLAERQRNEEGEEEVEEASADEGAVEPAPA